MRILMVIAIFASQSLAEQTKKDSLLVDIIFIAIKTLLFFGFEYMLFFAYKKYETESEEAAEEDRKFKEALDQLTDPVALVKKEKLEYVNDNFLEIFKDLVIIHQNNLPVKKDEEQPMSSFKSRLQKVKRLLKSA